MKLHLTEAELDDLRSIRSYTLETRGAEHEESYLRKIWNRIQSVLEDLLRQRLRDELFPGCRIVSEGRHVILFHATADTVTVACVLHSAMDFKRQLPPETG